MGTTENISRTGLLIHVDETLELNTRIEMIVELPPVKSAQGETTVRLVCQGQIVRTAEPPNRSSRPLMAATIAHYHFARE